MSETVIVALIGIAGTLLSPIVSSINERCKAKNERKLHAQRISFEYEFDLYRILAEKHLTMVYDAGTAVMLSRGCKYPNVDSNKDFVTVFAQHIDDADIENKRSAPCISKEIFEDYKKLGKLSFEALSFFDLLCKFEENRTPRLIYNGKSYSEVEAQSKLSILQKDISALSDNILDKIRNHISNSYNN